jgi:hypothetical protein
MTHNVLANCQWRKPSSKSANDWTVEELSAFKITFENQDSATFFGVDPLPHPVNIPATILTDISPNRSEQDLKTYSFLCYMIEAMRNDAITESAIENFVQALFWLMRYQVQPFLMRSCVGLTFFMCGEERNALTNVCVVDENQILLIIQGKQWVGTGDSEAELVAGAIAAFYHNNLSPAEDEFPLRKSGIMAGITMRDTSPIFHKIPITQDLVDCVAMGVEPSTDTKVLKHAPLFPDGFDKGMIPLRNRLVALKCYDAFKAFVFRDHIV